MSETKTDICPWCKYDRGPFPLYVYAHWSDRLDTKCVECGKPYYVRNGTAVKLKSSLRSEPAGKETK